MSQKEYDRCWGNGHGGSILVHVGTNNAEKEGTTAIIVKYRKLVCTLNRREADCVIWNTADNRQQRKILQEL